MTQHQHTTHARPAFTLVELLAVVVILTILIALFTVIGSSIFSSSRAARDTAQLSAIGQAIDAFETDFNYLPPLVPKVDGGGADITEGIVTTSVLAQVTPDPIDDVLQNNRYMSEYTITAYLLGIGGFDPSAPPNDQRGIAAPPNGFAGHDGVAGPGFKSPGRARCWKDTAALAAASDVSSINAAHAVTASGRTYGPYLDIASLEDNLVFDEDRQLFTITDTWGTPIRYYNGWPTRDPDEPNNPDRVSVERIPIELWSPELYDQFIARQQIFDDLDPNIDSALVGADYALLAAGDDPREFLDNNSEPIAPFGDVIVAENNNARTDIGFDANGTVDIPAGPANAAARISPLLETNVRFTR